MSSGEIDSRITELEAQVAALQKERLDLVEHFRQRRSSILDQFARQLDGITVVSSLTGALQESEYEIAILEGAIPIPTPGPLEEPEDGVVK